MANVAASEQEVVHITLSKGDDGYVIAECLDIPGCMSQGRTREEALANIEDAVSACLQVMMEDTFHDMKKRRTRHPRSGDSHQLRVSLSKPRISPA